MPQPPAKRKVMGRIDLSADHADANHLSATPPTRHVRTHSSIASTSTSSTRRPLSTVGSSGASTGRAKVDMSLMARPAPSASLPLSPPTASTPPIRRLNTSAGTPSTSSAALRNAVHTTPQTAGATSAPVTPRIGVMSNGASATTAASPSLASSNLARSSPFDRGEIPPNVTVRSPRRIRNRSQDTTATATATGSPLPTSATVSSLSSVSNFHGTNLDASGLSSSPSAYGGRASPVRGHARALTSHHAPAGSSLSTPPTNGRVGPSSMTNGFTGTGRSAGASGSSSRTPSPVPFVSGASRPTSMVGGIGPNTFLHPGRGVASENSTDRPLLSPPREASHRRPPLSAGVRSERAKLRRRSSSSLSGVSVTESVRPESRQGAATVAFHFGRGSRDGQPAKPTMPSFQSHMSNGLQQENGLGVGRGHSAHAPTATVGSPPSPRSLRANVLRPATLNGTEPLRAGYDDANPSFSPPLMSPASETSSAVSTASSFSHPSSQTVTQPPPPEHAQLRVERKIADLEITNKSLLAINSGLEVTKHRQAREIRELKRRLREGHTGAGGEVAAAGLSRAGLLSPGSTEGGEDDYDDYFGENAGADGDDLREKEDPELEAAHVRCKGLIDAMLVQAREAILYQYVHDETKSKVLTLGEMQLRDDAGLEDTFEHEREGSAEPTLTLALHAKDGSGADDSIASSVLTEGSQPSGDTQPRPHESEGDSEGALPAAGIAGAREEVGLDIDNGADVDADDAETIHGEGEGEAEGGSERRASVDSDLDAAEDDSVDTSGSGGSGDSGAHSGEEEESGDDAILQAPNADVAADVSID